MNLNTAGLDNIVIVTQAKLTPLVAPKCEKPAAERQRDETLRNEIKKIFQLIHLSVTTAVCSSPQAIICTFWVKIIEEEKNN